MEQLSLALGRSLGQETTMAMALFARWVTTEEEQAGLVLA